MFNRREAELKFENTKTEERWKCPVKLKDKLIKKYTPAMLEEFNIIVTASYMNNSAFVIHAAWATYI